MLGRAPNFGTPPLAENAPIPIEITGLPDGRLDAAVEAAGYFVVSEMAKGSAGPLRVRAGRRDSRVVVEVEASSAPEEILDLEDRVGALDGGLEIIRDAEGQVRIRAEIPCGS